MKSKIIQDKTSWKYLDWYFSKVGIAPHPPCPKLIDPKRMLVYLSGFQSLTEAVSHTSVGILSFFFFFFFYDRCDSPSQYLKKQCMEP